MHVAHNAFIRHRNQNISCLQDHFAFGDVLFLTTANGGNQDLFRPFNSGHLLANQGAVNINGHFEGGPSPCLG
jgi:hypothetical protein